MPIPFNKFSRFSLPLVNTCAHTQAHPSQTFLYLSRPSTSSTFSWSFTRPTLNSCSRYYLNSTLCSWVLLTLSCDSALCENISSLPMTLQIENMDHLGSSLPLPNIHYSAWCYSQNHYSINIWQRRWDRFCLELCMCIHNSEYTEERSYLPSRTLHFGHFHNHLFKSKWKIYARLGRWDLKSPTSDVRHSWGGHFCACWLF